MGSTKQIVTLKRFFIVHEPNFMGKSANKTSFARLGGGGGHVPQATLPPSLATGLVKAAQWRQNSKIALFRVWVEGWIRPRRLRKVYTIQVSLIMLCL